MATIDAEISGPPLLFPTGLVRPHQGGINSISLVPGGGVSIGTSGTVLPDGTVDMSEIRAAGLPIGKIRRFYGHNPSFDFSALTQGFNYLAQGVNRVSDSVRYAHVDLSTVMTSLSPAAADVLKKKWTLPNANGRSFDMEALRRSWRGEKDHRITLKDLRSTTPRERLEKMVDKLVEFTSLLIDEYILQNLTDPRKPEMIRLTRLFIRGQKANGKAADEYRYGKLSFFDTGMGITIRKFEPENEGKTGGHELIYNTVLSYEAKGDLNLQEPPMVEANWRPDLADEALHLLRQATVLDALAEL